MYAPSLPSPDGGEGAVGILGGGESGPARDVLEGAVRVEVSTLEAKVFHDPGGVNEGHVLEGLEGSALPRERGAELGEYGDGAGAGTPEGVVVLCREEVIEAWCRWWVGYHGERGDEERRERGKWNDG